MRCWHALVLVALSGCATGVVGSDETLPDGGGVTQKDSGTPSSKDSGTTFNGNDAGSTSQQDSGNTVVDSGNNNNNGCNAFQGTLATFDFTGEPGNQTSTAATSSAKDVTAGAISRASALTAISGTDSINSSAWAIGTKLDTTKYYTFELTPAAPCTLDITSLSITTKASATGPANAAVATSDDNFGQSTNFSLNVTATPSISVSGATGAVEVRVYGFGASASGGTMRVDSTLTVTGALN